MNNTCYLRTPSRASLVEATVADYLANYVYWLITEEPDFLISAIILKKMGKDVSSCVKIELVSTDFCSILG